MITKSTSRIVLGALLVATTHLVSAQKLPNEQETGLKAPSSVKIDGNAREWGDFQAYNKATRVFYSLANDDKNLYLVVHAQKEDVIGKIFYDGITLAIKSTSKDKKTSAVTATYPFVHLATRADIVDPLRHLDMNIDSLLPGLNKRIESEAKDIKISGFTETTEPSISVYNELGIKAVVLLDAKRTFTYELQLPLKYIAHLVDEASAFEYKITLNGHDLGNGRVVGGGSLSGGVSVGGSSSGPPLPDAFVPTSVSATYTLVKK